MITLNALPVNYEILNDLYEHTDQSFCLNRVAVPLDEDSTRNYFLAVRSGINNGMPFDFHGVLNMSLLEMVISGHAVKGKKLQAIIFSCPWR